MDIRVKPTFHLSTPSIIQLIEQYGTDFTLIKEFFPKKSKNQIKVHLS